MKAVWLVGTIVKSFVSGEHPEQGISNCPLASARLRIGVAATQWKRAGNENVFLDPEDPQAMGSIDLGEAQLWLGSDLIEGIKWSLANRGEVLARLRRGQALVSEKFAPEKLGRTWRAFFESLVHLHQP